MIPYWLNTPFVHALGWTLVHTLWQATLIAMIIRLLWLPVSQQQARSRYGLALAAMLTILIGATITFGYYYQTYQSNEMDILAWGFPDSSLPAGAEIMETTSLLDAELLIEGESAPSILETVLYTIENYLPWLVLAWLLGTIFMGLRLAGGWWQLRRLSKRGIDHLPIEWAERFSHLVEKMGIRRKVQLRFSRMVAEPITLKHLKPVILFPVGLINQLTTEQVEAILLHELAHIRRWDYLVNWIQSVFELLFFYHPAVWWLSGEVREAREHCCDDLVLGKGGAQRMLYAQTLTQLTALSFNNKSKLAMSVKGINGTFTQRVKRLFGHTETVFDWRKPVLSALICVSIFFGFSLSSNAIEDSGTDRLETLNFEKGSILENEVTDSFELVPFIRVSNLKLAFSKTTTPFTLIHQFEKEQEVESPDAQLSFTSNEITYDQENRSISARSMVLELKESLSELWVNGKSWGSDFQRLEQFDANNLESIVWNQNKNSLYIYSSGQTPTGFKPGNTSILSDTIPQKRAEITFSPERIDIFKSAGQFDWYRFPQKISLSDQKEEAVLLPVNKLSIDLTKKPLIILMDVSFKEVLDYQELTKLDPDQIVMVKSYPAPEGLLNQRPGRILIYTRKHLERYPDSVPALQFDPKADQNEEALSAPFHIRPLIIVDGKTKGRDTSLIKAIDPNTIESINVLQGISAMENYGPEAEEGALEFVIKGQEPLPITPSPILKEKPFMQDINQAEPLFIVDGENWGRDSERINALNPDDIESIDVLKGESAKTAYGEEGHNGVIVIHTKLNKKKTDKTLPGKIKIQRSEPDSLIKISPLHIVDGVNLGRNKDVISDLAPNDIESINVLKGESAKAAYGEEALNGVIVIHTKNPPSDNKETNEPLSGEVKIKIRGDQSPEAASPLFVVDGVKLERQKDATRDLDPNNIESVEVLKGEKAIEAYGDAGRDGVVIITTKTKPDTSPAQKKKKKEKPTDAATPKKENQAEVISVEPTLGPEMNVSLGVAQKIKGTFQAFPNPFKNETKLVFELPENLKARISIFNASGQLMKVLSDDLLTAGRHEFIWQSAGAPKGSYIVMIEAGGSRITQTIQKQ